jgi:hypothetical protein
MLVLAENAAEVVTPMDARAGEPVGVGRWFGSGIRG